MGKLIKMNDHSDDGRLLTLEEMLETMLEEVKSGKLPHQKGLLVLLDSEGGKYDVIRCQAGMKCSELLSLLDITHTLVKREMGF